jgi:hypothetical protein
MQLSYVHAHRVLKANHAVKYGVCHVSNYLGRIPKSRCCTNYKVVVSHFRPLPLAPPFPPFPVSPFAVPPFPDSRPPIPRPPIPRPPIPRFGF